MPGNRNCPGWEPRAASENCNGDSSLADGLDRAIENAATDWWMRGAMVAIGQLAREHRGFDVDDLLDLVGQPNDPHHVGAALAAARRQKLVEAVGARVGRGGRLVRVWWGLAS